MPTYSRALASSRRVGLGEERIAAIRARAAERCPPTRRLNSARIWFSARRTVAVEAMIFGPTGLPPTSRVAQCVERRLVEPDHRAERTGDQVQLVLDDQVRR